MATGWLALAIIAVGIVVIVILVLISRALGRSRAAEELNRKSLDRARRRHEIDADVARMSDPELDDDLNGRGR